MNKQFVIIDLEMQRYCLPIEMVSGIIDHFDLTIVPNSIPYVSGVSNIRGEVIPVVSLKKMFNINDSGTSDAKLLVISVNNQNVGFIVDGASNVVTVDAEDVSDTPALLRKNSKSNFSMVAKIDNDLNMVIDPTSIFSEDEQSQLKELVKE